MADIFAKYLYGVYTKSEIEQTHYMNIDEALHYVSQNGFYYLLKWQAEFLVDSIKIQKTFLVFSTFFQDTNQALKSHFFKSKQNYTIVLLKTDVHNIRNIYIYIYIYIGMVFIKLLILSFTILLTMSLHKVQCKQ